MQANMQASPKTNMQANMQASPKTNPQAMLHVYDLDGEEYSIPTENTHDVFRKYTVSAAEIAICKRLFAHPLPNVVRVYDVNEAEKYIDLEYLDVDMVAPKEDKLHDFANGIAQLHEHQVVYIDVKEDNIGYSRQDHRWKVFDFDRCGVVDPHNTRRWHIHPRYSYTYQKFRSVPIRASFYEYDEHILAYCKNNINYF